MHTKPFHSLETSKMCQSHGEVAIQLPEDSTTSALHLKISLATVSMFSLGELRNRSMGNALAECTHIKPMPGLISSPIAVTQMSFAKLGGMTRSSTL